MPCRDDVPAPALRLDLDASAWKIAQRAGHPRDRTRRLTPPHGHPTVNLYDNGHALPGDRLEPIWPVAACGKSDYQ